MGLVLQATTEDQFIYARRNELCERCNTRPLGWLAVEFRLEELGVMEKCASGK